MVEQIQRGFADVNGICLYYEVAGDGHPLVLNYGGGLWIITCGTINSTSSLSISK